MRRRIAPSMYLKRGLRRALRRRYAYAALRTLRRALGRAMSAHAEATVGAAPYNGRHERERIYVGFLQGLQRLRRRFPTLDLGDPRAEP